MFCWYKNHLFCRFHSPPGLGKSTAVQSQIQSCEGRPKRDVARGTNARKMGEFTETMVLAKNFGAWWQFHWDLHRIYPAIFMFDGSWSWFTKKNTNRITGWKIWVILCYFQTWRWDDDSQWHAYFSGRLKPPPRVSNYSKLFKMGNDPAKTGSKMI